MDQNLTLNNKILDLLSPLVLVVASTQANLIFQERGFSNVSEVFGPVFRDTVSIRDSSGKISVHQKYSVRFMTTEQYETRAEIYDPLEIAKTLSTTLSLYENSPNLLFQDSALSALTEQDQLPWYYDFMDKLTKIPVVLEHEALSLPIAVVVFLSTKDKDPVWTSNQLCGQVSGLDPTILKHHVLLTDSQSDVSRILDLGDCKSFDLDTANVLEIMGEFVQKHLLPHMETIVQHLNSRVFGPSKSMVSRFFGIGKRYFGSPSIAPTYSAETRKLLRNLADYSLLLRDYRLASSSYEYLKLEYCPESPDLAYIRTIELHTLSVVLADRGDSKLPDQVPRFYLENKLTLLSLRTLFWYSLYLREKGSTSRFVGVLYRFSQSFEGVLDAILMERIALAFVVSQRPMKRKALYYFVLASNRYRSSMHFGHALRTIDTAFQLLQGTGWQLLEDQIQYSMARDYRELGLQAQSREYYHKINNYDLRELGCGVSMHLKSMALLDYLDMFDPDQGAVQLKIPHIEAVSLAIKESITTLPRAPSKRVGILSSSKSLYNCGTVLVSEGDIVQMNISVTNIYSFDLKLCNPELLLACGQETRAVSASCSDLVLCPGGSHLALELDPALAKNDFFICGISYSLFGIIPIYQLY